MNYKGTLIAVKNCKKSFDFYHDMFGLELVADNDGNMELSNHIYLQEIEFWEKFIGENVIFHNNGSELYFEEADVEGFLEKLEKLYPETEYVNRKLTHSWGQAVTRFYDPDGNLIEVGTPI